MTIIKIKYKVCFFVMLFVSLLSICPSYALDSFTVSQIKYVNSVRDGVNVIVPALVQGTKNGVAVAEWGASVITPAVGSKVLGKFISGAGVLGAAYLGAELISYLYDKGYEYIQGQLNVAVPGSYGFNADVLSQLGVTNNRVYPYPLTDPDPATVVNCGVGQTPRLEPAVGWGLLRYVNGYPVMYKQAVCFGCCSVPEQNIVAPGSAEAATALGTAGAPSYTPATSGQIATLVADMQTDLQNQEVKSVAALDSVMGKIESAISSSTDPLTVASPTTVTDIKTELKDAVTDAQKTSMDDASGAADAQKTFGQQAAQVTKADVKNAINEAVSDGQPVTGPVLTPEIIPSMPEKITITSILNDWWSGFQSLPVISLFTNMAVTASGSPILAFQIPSFMGGSSTDFSYDMSKHSDTWEFMGNVLLMITGIRWTMYLFEG